MSLTAAICRALATASEPVDAADLARATSGDVNKISGALYALAKAGVLRKTNDAKPFAYAVADPAALQARIDGKRPRKAKTAKRATRERAAKRGRPRKQPAEAQGSDPAHQFFIDDDGDLQIARRDGEGNTTLIQRSEALRLADFLARMRPVLEAA